MRGDGTSPLPQPTSKPLISDSSHPLKNPFTELTIKSSFLSSTILVYPVYFTYVIIWITNGNFFAFSSDVITIYIIEYIRIYEHG